MRTFTLLIVLSLFIQTTLSAQSCLPEGITITTQAEIDNFQTNYPNCTEIEGDVWISGYSISNFSGLNVLTSIGGSLTIGHPNYNNPNLISLTGLEGLTSIGRDIHISWNNSLTSISGLNNVTSIGGSLAIDNNDALISLTGFNNVDSIAGPLSIDNNLNLTNIAGLNNLSYANQLYITNNNSLASCEEPSICNYLLNQVGYINIYNNASGCNNPIEVADACGINIDCLPFVNYYFISQADIDSFPTIFPNCLELEGKVIISGEDITNLNGLSVLTSIGGLRIENNDVLTNLTGLDNVTSIEGSIRLYWNESLVSLSGLENVTSISGLEISANFDLTSLEGLNNLISIEGGGLYINSNFELANLTGLESLTSIGGNLTIMNSSGWPPNDGLKNLTGLDNLTSIGGSFRLGGNDNLSSLTGLENLVTIGTDLIIGAISPTGGNQSLKSFSGLNNLNTIGGSLRINANDSLTSLTGLGSVDAASITNLSIYNNPFLSTCEIKSICDYLADPNGIIEIHDNALGCNSQLEVEEACETVSTNEFSSIGSILTSPNPFTTSTTLSYSLKQPSTIQLSVFNQLGQLVYQRSEDQQQGMQKLQWKAEDQPEGLYYYKLLAGNQQGSGKLVKAK